MTEQERKLQMAKQMAGLYREYNRQYKAARDRSSQCWEEGASIFEMRKADIAMTAAHAAMARISHIVSMDKEFS